MRVVEINEALLKRFPSKTRKQLRMVVQGIVKSANRKLTNARIVDFTVRGLGRFKTHGGRVKRNKKHIQKLGRQNKRKIYLKKQLKKENILW